MKEKEGERERERGGEGRGPKKGREALTILKKSHFNMSERCHSTKLLLL